MRRPRPRIYRLPALVARMTERCGELGAASDSPGWLSEKAALSMFGLSPQDIWDAALQRIPELAREVLAAAPDVGPDLLSFRAPADWPLDGGFHGVVPLLEQADEQLARARASWDMTPSGDGTDPYADILDSPYHLVAGSYLAAIGRAAGAALLCRERARPSPAGGEMSGPASDDAIFINCRGVIDGTANGLRREEGLLVGGRPGAGSGPPGGPGRPGPAAGSR